jgi:hypothetical protein
LKQKNKILFENLLFSPNYLPFSFVFTINMHKS